MTYLIACWILYLECIYADDTHLTFASNNILYINTVLNEDLARVEKWLIANKLTLMHPKLRLCWSDPGKG